MNKLDLENSLKNIEETKIKMIKKILYDCLRYMNNLHHFKKWIDEDGSKLTSLKELFKFKTLPGYPDKLFFVYDDVDIKIIIIDVLLSLPVEEDYQRRKFRKYKNKFGFYCNQQKKIEHQIWKIDTKLIVNETFYPDLSNMIMDYV